MSDILQTIAVVGENKNRLLINLSDFDKDKHEVWKDSDEGTPPAAPADEGTPPAAYRVESNGKSGRAVRYLIKDAEDKQVGEEYTSKKAANEAFEALTSEASK